jgi:ribose transport system substrate-binding protein
MQTVSSSFLVRGRPNPGTSQPKRASRRAALLALAFGVLAACKSDPQTTTTTSGAQPAPAKPEPAAKIVKLAFLTNNASEFWKIAQAGVRKYELESKVQVDVILPDGTVADQNKKLEELASQNYDAVAVSVVAPSDQVKKLDEVAAKTKLITFDSDAPDSKRLLYIGTNNHEAGKALGGEINKLLPQGGKMAVFVGTLSADNAQQRLKGIEDAIAGHNITIVDKREDQTDRAKAQSNVEDIINAHSDLDLVAGLWSYNGPAIALAIDRLGKKGKIKAAAFDEEEETLRAIENDTIAATVVQKPFMFGYLSSKWMHELATAPEATIAKLPKDGVLDTGVDVITKANVAEFKAKLAEMKSVK